MRDDLEELDISHDQLQKLTNLPVNNKLIIITDIIQDLSRQLLKKLQGTENSTLVFAGLSMSVFIYLLIKSPFWIPLIIFTLWTGVSIQTILYLLWQG
ncbi:MAG: hypothetical protein ACKN9K_24230, partial [Dolichospermum sp.]